MGEARRAAGGQGVRRRKRRYGVSYRSLMALGAVVLLVVAATTIDVPPVVWQPSGPVRLGVGGVGVLLAFSALLVGRTGAASDRDKPAADEAGAAPDGRRPNG